MPQYLPLPDGSFLTLKDGQDPKDAWLKAIEKYPEAFGVEPPKPVEPTFGGQVKEFAKGVIPGAVGMGQTALTGISALLPEETEKSARQYIDRGAAALKAPFAAAPGYEETVGRKFGEAVGSIGPFIAMGPLGAAGRIGMTALAGGAGAGEARIGAEQEGATAEQRSTATALGVIPGLAEVFAPMRILGRLSAPIQAGIANKVQRALVAGGEEAAQEAASQIAQNLIAKGVYKPDQAIIEQVGESAAYGGATGALVQGILDMAIGRRAKGTQQQPPQGAQQAAAATAVAPAMEAAIPEPTLRGEAAPTTEPAETPEEIAAGPQTKAQAKRLAAEQAAFLKQYEEQAALREQQAAEYERIKAMTPEEYAAEQMQGKAARFRNGHLQRRALSTDAYLQQNLAFLAHTPCKRRVNRLRVMQVIGIEAGGNYRHRGRRGRGCYRLRRRDRRLRSHDKGTWCRRAGHGQHRLRLDNRLFADLRLGYRRQGLGRLFLFFDHR